MAIFQAVDNILNGDLRGQAGDFLGKEAASGIKKAGEAFKSKVLGIEPNIYDVFLRNLLNSSNTLQLKPLWLCVMDGMPYTAITNEFDKNANTNHEFIDSNESSSVDGPGKAKVALLAQRCQFVGDSFNVTRPTNVEYNGFMPGGISNTRTPYQTLKISYLETNKSFTDNHMRSWLIYSSYKSLKFAERSKITVFKYNKRGFNEKTYDKPIKSITYHNCVPINIATEELDYKGGDAIIVRQVEFFYDTYTMNFDTSDNFDSQGFFGRALEEFTGYKTLGSAIANIGNDLTNEITSIAATGAQRLISNASIFGRESVSIGEAFGFGSGPGASQTSGKYNPPANDNIISTPVPDDVKATNIDADTPQPVPYIETGERIKSLPEVVEDQIRVAKISDYVEVLPDSLDTPVAGLTYDYVQDDVVVNKNDTPVFGTPIQDDVKINPNDTPNTLT